MKTILSIFLSITIFVGSIVLPVGDFNYLSQLPKVYNIFVNENGSTSLDEFFEEQFFEPFSLNENEQNEKDNPKETEKHPVPINLFSINPIAYEISTILCVTKEISSIEIPLRVFYYNNYKSITLKSIFHPPHLV